MERAFFLLLLVAVVVGASSLSLSSSGADVEAKSWTLVESLGFFFLTGSSSSSSVATAVVFSLRFLAATSFLSLAASPPNVRLLYLLSSPPAEGLRVDGAASSSLWSTSRAGGLKHGPVRDKEKRVHVRCDG